MNKKLLTLLAIFIMAGTLFAQPVANKAPDIHQCDNATFSLTAQTAAILGNQVPSEFTLKFFTSQADAQTNKNAITNPQQFTLSSTEQVIFARVTSKEDNTFAITSFTLSWSSTYMAPIPSVSVCDAYILPVLQVGNYYTEPHGQGTLISAGTAITASKYIYVYANKNGCIAATSFNVTINGLPILKDMVVCGSGGILLPELSVGNYYTAPNGGGELLLPRTVINTTQTIYVYLPSTCSTSGNASFTVTFIPVPQMPVFSDVTACNSYTLPPLPAGNYFTEPEGGGTLLKGGDVITKSQVIYAFYYVYPCSAGGRFSVTILGESIDDLKSITSCDDNRDGVANFDLTPVIAPLQKTYPGSEITFFGTNTDATANINPLTNLTSYASKSGVVYVKVNFNKGCSSITKLPLIVVPCTGNIIAGTVRYDRNGNGCDINDKGFANVQVMYANGNEVYNTFTNMEGQYSFINVPDGINNVTLTGINKSTYSASPANTTVTMPGDVADKDFCISQAAPVSNVGIIILPTAPAVPGIDAGYYISYTNLGTLLASGTITLQYDNTKLTYKSSVLPANVNGNTITFNYANLEPGVGETTLIYFTVAKPPVANIGDKITFIATITPVNDTAYTSNNTYSLSQVIVSSYDPNEITVNEGKFITLAQADDYLHYTIRFQNEGTANAEIVKIATTLDDNLDWDTFEPITASHTYQANRKAGVTEFVFNNIQLPFKSANEPGSHGFISYRIKPKAGVKVGDVMSGTAGIYFDFNEAIVTNTATTTIKETAGIKNFSDNSFTLYPNPASGTVTLQLQNNLVANATITINDILGKTVAKTTIDGTQSVINIAGLTSGMYFVTLKSGDHQVTKKLIVK